MGAVQFARLARRHGLEGRGRDRPQQLDDVRAAMDAAQPLADGAMETAADPETDQLPEVGSDVAAHPVGRLVGHRLDVDDGELVVDREADRHVVHEVAGLQRAPPFVGMLIGFLVGDATLDVPQAVVPKEALADDASRMQMLSPDRWRKRHGSTSRNREGGVTRPVWRRAARCATRRCACLRASEYRSENRRMHRSGRLRGCGGLRAGPVRRW